MFAIFSVWKTEAQRRYATSTCLCLIIDEELSKCLKPGLINPKSHVLPLTPQSTGKVLEACGGEEK